MYIQLTTSSIHCITLHNPHNCFLLTSYYCLPLAINIKEKIQLIINNVKTKLFPYIIYNTAVKPKLNMYKRSNTFITHITRMKI